VVASGWVVACGRSGGGRRDRTGGAGVEDAERSGWGRGGCLSSGNRSALGGRWGVGAALRGGGANRPWSFGGMESAAAELPGRQAPAAPDPGRARTRVDAPPCLRVTPSSSLRSTSARCARFERRRWERGGLGSGRGGRERRSGRPWSQRRRGANTAAPQTALNWPACAPRDITDIVICKRRLVIALKMPVGRRPDRSAATGGGRYATAVTGIADAGRTTAPSRSGRRPCRPRVPLPHFHPMGCPERGMENC
jgi:hypothetical protein